MRYVALLCALLLSAPAFAEEGEDPSTPPSMTLGGSRSSNTYVELPTGSRVAVGKGIEWQGKRIHLSVLWDLVAVDPATGKTLWHQDVGAFWNKVGFKELEVAGEMRWAVELQPGPRARRGAEDLRQYHDLETGEKILLPEQIKAPSGKEWKPRLAWKGDDSEVGKDFTLIVSTEANWQAVRERLFGKDSEHAAGKVDFAKEVVLIVSFGDGANSSGIHFEEGYEDDARVLARVDRSSYQTMGGWDRVRPWGAFVLPRRKAKAYVVERDVQNLIRGPRIWKGLCRWERLGDPSSELSTLPPRSARPTSDDERRAPPPPPVLPPPKKDR